MDILKQYYLILVLFIFTALFIVFAVNNIYITNTSQFIFITVFIILFIIILVVSSKFYKLFYTNRYLVYGVIILITIILIVLIATNTYENFVGIKINKTDNTSSTVFASDIDTNTTLTDITNKQDISPVTVSDVNKICITNSNHFGVYDKDLKCKSPYDIANEKRLERERKLREEELEKERLIEEEENERKEILEHEKMCQSKYIPQTYNSTKYCLDSNNNNNKIGVKSVDEDIEECPGYKKVECAKGYYNKKKKSKTDLNSLTQCHPKNSNFDEICQLFMSTKNLSNNSSNNYGYAKKLYEGEDGNCEKYYAAAMCSSDYNDGSLKTPFYSSCLASNSNLSSIKKNCKKNYKNIDLADHIINTDGCNPGYMRYCCNEDRCMEQINLSIDKKN